jgi:hypothetical protein
MTRTRRTHRGRAWGIGALATLLLVPWPGAPGDVAGQRRPSPAGAVAPRVDDSNVVGRAPPLDLVPGGVGARAAPVGRAPRRRRDPFLAGVLGAVVPGLGHAYAGEFWRGAAVFLVAEGGMITALKADDHTVGGVSATIGFGAYLFSILDAPGAASRYNQRHDRPPIQ